MARYWIIGILLLAGVWTLVYLIDGMGEKLAAVHEDLDSGGHRLARRRKGQQAKLPPAMVRPRHFKEECLSFRLSKLEAAAAKTGSQLLSLRGNDLLFRRPGSSSFQWTQSLVGKELGDRLMREALKLQESTDANAWRMVARAEGREWKRGISPSDGESFLTRELPRTSRFLPKALLIQLRKARRKKSAINWAFPRTDPATFLKAKAPLRAPKSTMQRLLDTWSIGATLRHPGSERYYQIAWMEVALP